MIDFKQLLTCLLFLQFSIGAEVETPDQVDAGNDTLRYVVSRERTEKITTATLSFYLLLEKIKFVLEQNTIGDKDDLDYFASKAALAMVEKAAIVLKKIIAGLNNGVIHNLSVEYKFLQAYGSAIPDNVQPKDLREFSKKIEAFELFINDFVKKKRSCLTVQELSLIDNIMQLNYFTKILMNKDFLNLGVIGLTCDLLLYKPQEFVSTNKGLIFGSLVLLGAMGLSYYYLTPEIITGAISRIRNRNV